METAGNVFILVLLLLTLQMGGALLFGALFDRMRLPKPRVLPLRLFHTGEIVYTEEQWRRDSRKEHPIRYFLTEVLGPRARHYKS